MKSVYGYLLVLSRHSKLWKFEIIKNTCFMHEQLHRSKQGSIVVVCVQPQPATCIYLGTDPVLVLHSHTVTLVRRRFGLH